jgi:arsenite methyltransferase
MLTHIRVGEYGGRMTQELQDEIQQRYGAIARRAASGCCGDGCGCDDEVTRNLYNEAERNVVPAEAFAASLGCGNPTALIELQPGQTVLDLGSGGGIDVLLSARRVGPSGTVYGLDMTDEMLALARENQRKADATNVEFLKGTIEAIPLPDSSVDVIISNCVINLSPDKDRVLREAFRVLRPGGQFAVSDVVSRGPVPDEVRRSVDCWVGCMAGALDQEDYSRKLRAAGFVDVSIEPWREYADGTFASAFIRGQKPAKACCGPTCCA